MSAPIISINQVHKAFGGAPVLEGVDLSIVGNSIVGLAGPSGGGKSTLLRCIQGLEKPDSGTILCQGKVGFMFQDFQLFPHMTVLQNLLYAPRLKDKSVAPRQRAEELLTHLKIASKADSFPDRLSGGQKQRVALARCLMTNPNVLLCDEPTSGLDVVTTSDIVSLLQTVRVMGVTMVLASHDLDFLTQISDRIIFLKGGRILLDQDRRQQTDSLDSLHALYRTSLSEEE